MKIKYYKLLGLLICMSICNFTYSQSQEKLLNNSWQVQYQLDNTNQFTGPYSIMDKEKVILRGAYKDGERKGNWFVFNKEDKLVIRYNYDDNQVLAMDEDEIIKAKIKIFSKDDEAEKNARVSFPLLSIDHFTSYMAELVKNNVPHYLQEKDKIIPIEITAKISKSGEASYAAKYIINKREYVTTLLLEEKEFVIDWIPAHYKGENYASEFIVYSKVQFDDAANHKRVIWN